MKRIFCILALVAFSSFALNACTEEEVTPTMKTKPKTGGNGGGLGIDPK